MQTTAGCRPLTRLPNYLPTHPQGAPAAAGRSGGAAAAALGAPGGLLLAGCWRVAMAGRPGSSGGLLEQRHACNDAQQKHMRGMAGAPPARVPDQLVDCSTGPDWRPPSSVAQRDVGARSTQRQAPHGLTLVCGARVSPRAAHPPASLPVKRLIAVTPPAERGPGHPPTTHACCQGASGHGQRIVRAAQQERRTAPVRTLRCTCSPAQCLFPHPLAARTLPAQARAGLRSRSFSIHPLARAMDLALLDRADPGAWYMDSQKYAELADAQLVVEGMALPAHSQLLARASPVVLDLLRDQRRGSVRVEGAAAPAEVSEGLFGAPPPPGARPTPARRRAAPPPPPAHCRPP